MAAGIEPAKGRLTVARPYQHGNTTRFSRRGWVRTSIFVLPKHADFPFLPHAEIPAHGVCGLLFRAPSGSRTRTSAMARQQAAATSWARPTQPDCQIASGNGGSRALTSRLRAGNAAIHTTYPVFQVVALRIELSAPRLSAEDGPPALDYRSQVARMGIEPISPP